MADINARTRLLIGTTADWAAHNLVLGSGELVVERAGSRLKLKVGDGASLYSALPFVTADPIIPPEYLTQDEGDARYLLLSGISAASVPNLVPRMGADGKLAAAMIPLPPSVTVSAGPADAGKLVALADNGKISPTMISITTGSYRGAVNATAAVPAGSYIAGDYFINSGTGPAHATWGLPGGTTVAPGNQLVYDGTTWGLIGASSAYLPLAGGTLAGPGNLTVSGLLQVNGGARLSGVPAVAAAVAGVSLGNSALGDASISTTSSGAPVDTKIWDTYFTSDGAHSRVIDDAIAIGNEWMTVSRSGMAVPTIAWPISRLGVGLPASNMGGGSGNTLIDGNLIIKAAGSATALFIPSGSAFAGLKIKTGPLNGNGGTDYFDFTVRPGGFGVGANADKIVMRFEGAVGNDPNLLLQPTSGNVGIGVAVPATKLHMAGAELRLQFDNAYLSGFSTAGIRQGFLQFNVGGNGVLLTAEGVNPVSIAAGGATRLQITSGGVIQDGAGNELGYRNMPRIDQAGGGPAVTIRGKMQGLTSTADYTIPATGFTAGDCFSICNFNAAPVNIIQGAGLLMHRSGTASTGNRVLAGYGTATFWFANAAECFVSGPGVS